MLKCWLFQFTRVQLTPMCVIRIILTTIHIVPVYSQITTLHLRKRIRYWMKTGRIVLWLHSGHPPSEYEWIKSEELLTVTSSHDFLIPLPTVHWINLHIKDNALNWNANTWPSSVFILQLRVHLQLLQSLPRIFPRKRLPRISPLVTATRLTAPKSI